MCWSYLFVFIHLFTYLLTFNILSQIYYLKKKKKSLSIKCMYTLTWIHLFYDVFNLLI